MCAFLTFSASPGNGPYETVRPISRTPTKESGSRNPGPFSFHGGRAGVINRAPGFTLPSQLLVVLSAIGYAYVIYIM